MASCDTVFSPMSVAKVTWTLFVWQLYQRHRVVQTLQYEAKTSSADLFWYGVRLAMGWMLDGVSTKPTGAPPLYTRTLLTCGRDGCCGVEVP